VKVKEIIKLIEDEGWRFPGKPEAIDNINTPTGKEPLQLQENQATIWTKELKKAF